MIGKATISLIVVLVAAVAMSGGTGATPRHAVNSPSFIFVTPHFYSMYEHLKVEFLVGEDDSCVQDEYGGYDDPGCYDVDGNNADWDMRVYQTYPRWRFVYSDRTSTFDGKDSTNLYWSVELGAPFCFSTSWTRSYKAVFRLFSPIDDRVLARDTETFGVRCH
jgi:hypothetical protein